MVRGDFQGINENLISPTKCDLSPKPMARGDEFLDTNNSFGKSKLIATKANAPLMSFKTSLPASKKLFPNLMMN